MSKNETENQNEPWTDYPNPIEEALRERRVARQEEKPPRASFRINLRRLLESRGEFLAQTALLERLKPANPCLQPFMDRDALVATLLDRKVPPEAKTEILLVLIREHHRSTGASVALSLLVRAFLPLIEKIYWEVVGTFDPQDEDDVFARLVGAFTESVSRYPDGVSTMVAGRLEMTTRKRFFVAYERERRPKQTENAFRAKSAPVLEDAERCGRATQSQVLAGMVRPPKKREAPPPLGDEEIAKAEALLEKLLHGRRLPPDRKRLLVLVYGCGWTFETAATELGLDPQSARRWAAREKKTIRKANPEIELSDVPETDETDTF